MILYVIKEKKNCIFCNYLIKRYITQNVASRGEVHSHCVVPECRKIRLYFLVHKISKTKYALNISQPDGARGRFSRIPMTKGYKERLDMSRNKRKRIHWMSVDAIISAFAIDFSIKKIICENFNWNLSGKTIHSSIPFNLLKDETYDDIFLPKLT